MKSKRIFFILIALSFFSIGGYSQEKKIPYLILRGAFLFPSDTSFQIKATDSIEFPKYLKGISSLYQTLLNTTTDNRIIKNNICGFVRADITFNENGAIDTIEIKEKIGTKLFDEDALTALRKLENWSPLKINSISSRFKIRISVPFGNDFKTGNNGQAGALSIVSIQDDAFHERLNCVSLDMSGKADRDFYYYQGNKYLAQQKYEEAIDWFGFAMVFNTKDIDAIFNQAACYFRIGKTDKACELWKKGESLGDTEAKELTQKNCK